MLTRLWSERGRDVVLRNAAVNGYRTDDLIDNELPLIADFKPTLVTVLIGANDIVAGSTPERYRAQLRTIHSRVRDDAPTAALYALPQPDWSLSSAAASFGDVTVIARRIELFNRVAGEEVRRASGIYVDIFPLMRKQMRREMLAPDALHPSADAYGEWADALRERLAMRAS